MNTTTEPLRKTRIKPEIITVRQMLSTTDIGIPNYQRPYKWSLKNVNQLIDDILLFNDKPAYRLGTVVYHQENGNATLNIVDGQQRTITLLLITLAIFKNQNIMAQINALNIKFPEAEIWNSLKFKHPISKHNIRTNFLEIQRRIIDFKPEHVDFFFNRCEIVKVVLFDISEAFQFFDSQNARGKDLDPHDLLKAFHLREMMNSSNELERIKTVNQWESTNMEDLKNLFSHYLYRIRRWAKGKSAREFQKNNVDEFKGVSPNLEEQFNYTVPYRITHFYVDNYNDDYHRKIDQKTMSYPFQLDQVVINGKRFFEMISYYLEVKSNLNLDVREISLAQRILETLENYEGRFRTGDKYVRNLFDCALIYYMDKFGKVELERAIEKIFIWAYTLRIKHHTVQLATMDNYALEYPRMFKEIRDAIHPSDILNKKINEVKQSEIYESPKTEALVSFFHDLKYIHE